MLELEEAKAAVECNRCSSDVARTALVAGGWLKSREVAISVLWPTAPGNPTAPKVTRHPHTLHVHNKPDHPQESRSPYWYLWTYLCFYRT
jgi:hypothetical protein